MPNIKSAAKRARQAVGRRQRNRSEESLIHAKRRAFLDGLNQGDKAKSLQLFRVFCAALDKAVKKGIVPKNTANRSKQRASAALAKAKA